MSLKKEFSSGVFITFVSKYSNVLIQLVLGVILARLLSPEEFGVVAIVTVFINFFYLLTTAGIGTAIIQIKNLDEEAYGIIFNYTVLIGIVLSVIFYFSSFSIAVFYDNSLYISFGKILSISIFFYSITSVPQALMNKKREFKKMAKVNISTNLIAGIIAAILAYSGFSYYALIIQTTIKAILQFFISFKYSKLEIIKKINLMPLKRIYSYAGYDFLFKFINYFSRNADNFLIGKFLGPVSLGYYDKAYRLMLYPMQMLTGVITPVLHPVLANYQNNKTAIYQTYSKVIGILAILGVPISVIIFFSSYDIVVLMYGPKWEMSVPPFKILSTSVWIQMILSSSGSIFQSSGRTDLLFLSGALTAIITVTGILIGVLFFKNIESLSVILVIAFSINFLQTYWLMYRKIFNKSLMQLFRLLVKPVMIGIVMIFVFLIFDINIDRVFISLFIKTMLGGFAFIITAIVIKEPITLRVFKEIKSIIEKKIDKRKNNGGM